MKWLKKKTLQPQNGDYRIVRSFLLLPLELPIKEGSCIEQTKWLCMGNIKQNYCSDKDDSCWYNVCWATD